jgi:predicted phage terminase large subunit-like protein
MEKMDLPKTIRAVLKMSKDYPRCRIKLVEDAANGPAVMQTLKKRLPGLVPVAAKGSKESRLMATQPMFEAENVWFPDPSIRADIKERVDDLCTFPSSPIKDFVDMIAHGLNRYSSMQVRKQAHAPDKAISYADEALLDANSWY